MIKEVKIICMYYVKHKCNRFAFLFATFSFFLFSPAKEATTKDGESTIMAMKSARGCEKNGFEAADKILEPKWQ